MEPVTIPTVCELAFLEDPGGNVLGVARCVETDPASSRCVRSLAVHPARAWLGQAQCANAARDQQRERREGDRHEKHRPRVDGG